jgi:predicted glycosyltransferase
MRVLFDIVHPAHVHFYRHLHGLLRAEGHETLVVARDKEVTLQLLDAFDMPYEWTGRAGSKTTIARAAELVTRDVALTRWARRFRPDVILTRNPAGVHAGRAVGAWTVYDSVDGRAAGVHFQLGAPLAHVITSPNWLDEDYGPRHRRYRGPKELAYLHPDRFRPDPGVRAELGVLAGQPLFVLRFVANDAVHDAHTVGLDTSQRAALVRRLQGIGHVVISSEEALPADLESRRHRLGPERIHDVLAAADLFVGDSGSMAAEAGVLGTPALRLSSWVGPVRGYLGRMESDYGLVRCFTPDTRQGFEVALDEVLADLPAAKAAAQDAAARLVADCDDVTGWYRALLEELVARDEPPGRRRWRRRAAI